MNQLAGISGYVLLIIGLLYALTTLYTALTGKTPDSNAAKILRVTAYVSIGIFVLDYLLGHYASNTAAMTAFVNKMGMTGLYGIILVALSGLSLIASRILSITAERRRSDRHPDSATIWRCLLHGLIVSTVSFALRWLMTGNF